EIVGVVLGDIDHLPKIVAPIANQVLSNKESSAEVANLNEVFFDEEDGTNLIYEVTGNSAPERLSVELQESGAVVVSYGPDVLGAIDVEITATDSGGNYSRVRF